MLKLSFLETIYVTSRIEYLLMFKLNYDFFYFDLRWLLLYRTALNLCERTGKGIFLWGRVVGGREGYGSADSSRRPSRGERKHAIGRSAGGGGSW